MNTDNMALSGETLDYGPCAFMDAYDPATVFSSIDSQGRYAYGNQPAIAQWNLARLAEAMLPLIHPDAEEAVKRAEATLRRFADCYEHHWLAGMRPKLGLFTEEDTDRALVDDLLEWMRDHLRRFHEHVPPAPHRTARMAGRPPRSTPGSGAGRRGARGSRTRAPRRRILMRRHNPAVIPRNHKVEEALESATAGHDLAPLVALLDVLAAPFDHERDLGGYDAPAAIRAPYRTFCGTSPHGRRGPRMVDTGGLRAVGESARVRAGSGASRSGGSSPAAA